MNEVKNEIEQDSSFIDHPAPEVIEKQNQTVLIPNTYPWIRYFARAVDGVSFFVIISVILSVSNQGLIDPLHRYFGILSIFLWVFVESLLLSFVGTTPGKWLLRVHLTNKYGNKLSLVEAFKRSVQVWYYGMGAGIHLVSIATQSNAYSKLTKEGLTSWDKVGGFIVTHEKISLLRASIVFGYVILILIVGLRTVS